jgi:hypothetical protein
MFALIRDDTELKRQPLALLEAEISREKLVNVDKDTANKFASLTKRIAEETAALEKLKDRLAHCEGAVWRCSGGPSAYFDTTTWARRPAPGRLRSNGNDGSGG